MRSGDGFIRCSDGHVRWGLFGAAGVVFVLDRDPTRPVMLQRRSMFSHEGGTWSCAGGALHEGEAPLEGALREATEEVGALPDPLRVLGHYVFRPATDWTYITAVVGVDDAFGVEASFETDALDWVPIAEVDQRPLHVGFAAAWPHLREIIRASRPPSD